MRHHRSAISLLALGLFLSACGGGDGTATGAAGDPTPQRLAGGNEESSATTGSRVERSPVEDVPSALDDPTADGLPEPVIDVDRIRSGGPPPDGIPPIDDPVFMTPEDVDVLADDEPVVAVTVNGDSRAYPVQVLTWHEIVNDTVGGVPVAVTYCPLCNSALVFDTRVGERVLDFGTSGSLYLSNLVMYDRQTESLWPQAEGEAVAGVLTGERLVRIPAGMVPWATWREANPDGLVLSRDTGHDRPYGENPYVGYDEVGTEPFLFDDESDPRLPAKERVVAFGEPDDPVAVVTSALLDEGVIEVDVEGVGRVAALAVAGQASALDSAAIAEGRDVGTTGVFVARVGEEELTLSREPDGRFVDSGTGSTWTVLGEAVAGPLTGEVLERVPSVDTFWFTWAAFQPETRLVGGGGVESSR